MALPEDAHQPDVAIGINFGGGEEATGELEAGPDTAGASSDIAPARLGGRRTALHKIGRAVLRLRLYYGWSQRDLEHKSKVDQTTISRLERGVLGGLSIRRLAAILDALHVGEIVFDQPELIVAPTALEIMLFGDRWALACEEADRRLRWPPGPAG